MISFEFDIKLSIKIILTFIVFTVIGTLSHEYGHIGMANYLGYKTQLHYGSMNYYQKGYLQDSSVVRYKSLFEKYKRDFSDMSLNDKKEVNNLSLEINKKFPVNKEHSLYISIGGPLQTFLTSFVGLFLLYVFQSKKQLFFRKRDWLAVFLSLFALREVFNFVMAIVSVILFNKEYFVGDEFKISRLLGYNQWTIPLIAMFLGSVICLFLVFNVLLKKYRFTFIISGFIGGILGYILWFQYLGKLILP